MVSFRTTCSFMVLVLSVVPHVRYMALGIVEDQTALGRLTERLKTGLVSRALRAGHILLQLSLVSREWRNLCEP